MKETKIDPIFIRFLRKINILPRFLLVLLAICILPIVCTTIFNFEKYVDELRGNTQQYLTLLTSNLTNQINGALQDYEDKSLTLYANTELISNLTQNNEIAKTDDDFLTNDDYIKNKEEISKFLYLLSMSDLNIVNFSLITPYDQYQTSSYVDNYSGAIVKDLEYFKNTKYYKEAIERKGTAQWYDTSNNNSIIYRFEYSVQGISNTYTMTRAIYSPQTKEFLCILMINIDNNIIKNNFTNYSFYNTGNTFVISEEDAIIALNPNINAPNITYIDGLQEQIWGNQRGDIATEHNGKNIFLNFQKSNKLPIYVTHIVDMDSLLVEAYAIRKNSMIAVCILLLFIIVLAYTTSLSISLPLKRLVSSMSKFSEDFSTERVIVNGNDDLSKVSERFNLMADDIQKLMEQIVQSHIREKDLEISTVTAKLNALQMQINPHFMYNTLDIIRWSAINVGNGENEASKMIDKFCKLMRMSIKKDEGFITVSDELEHVFAYIDVVNMGGSKEINLISELEFDTSMYKLPKLTLQPLVENCVIHAFRKNSDQPCIHIRGWKIADHIMITVTDNGHGMTEERLEILRENFSDISNFKETVGLRNVNQRFKLCFGDEFGVSVESFVNFGTEIVIRMPLSNDVKNFESFTD